MNSSFIRHLWPLTEYQVGQPIFVVAAFGEDHFKLVSLPKGVMDLPLHLETQFIGLLARVHYVRNRGKVQCFGCILRYLYLRAPLERWIYSTDGHLLSRSADPPKKGNYSITLKGKPNRDISFLFRRHLCTRENGDKTEK